ncbi:NAD(P)-dependent dehydrogenase (short-subunit alcohol dehydrogenase family) [Sphingobium fontiphilum]|uniref:NAD(P)-dependent dehydrogenase (Short-subunit alcohol dehydrogenase family) n=1 Tax=Sphingobium fontiphilum TaxID=944425 RepID=A0A7W6GPV3_9SPHN|nr:SDR family oxidoreductase [Sphingobium fontiphilum]MBB3982803.1 NAD(P)-dependent dehydrogenase (short-subunit alcohol dehydrogenase family) [Sphingobium fontiphilum]
MAERFTGRVALVTAGADGIGAATARAFAADGAVVVLADINDALGEERAEALRAAGFAAHYIHADATDEEQVAALVRQTVERFGGLHLAANVVGDAHPDSAGPDLHTQPVSAFDHTITMCLRTTFICLKHEIAHMVDHGGGAICNVTSLAGMIHNGFGGAGYGAGKAGVIRLTKFAAVSYADRGIRVNCIAPGVTPTRAYYKFGDDYAKVLIGEQVINQPIARAIGCDEQAAGIAWLCSDEAAMVTGHVLPIDGGWTAK